jgi:hypothetical protein
LVMGRIRKLKIKKELYNAMATENHNNCYSNR